VLCKFLPFVTLFVLLADGDRSQWTRWRRSPSLRWGRGSPLEVFGDLLFERSETLIAFQGGGCPVFSCRRKVSLV
jgi:hypothetical protein